MFTQCSKCETVFRLSAEALRAAGGQVRCGRCGEVFNALSRLAEDVAGFTKGESSLFLESRAEEILESSAPVEPVDARLAEPLDAHFTAAGAGSEVPPGVEIAELSFLGPIDEDLAAETSLEFTLPPGDLDRVFVETRPSPLQQLSADGRRGEWQEPTTRQPAAHPESTPNDTPPAIHPESPLVPAGSRAADPGALLTHAGPPAAHPESVLASVAAKPALRVVKVTRPPPLTRIAGLEIAKEVRRDLLSSFSQADPPRVHEPRARLSLAAWLTAAIALGLLLVVQVVRGNDAWLAHVPLLGGSRSPLSSLSLYQLRQWGVTGDPDAKGTLRVRASILNTAAQLQPYPLLRVTLLDRFGTRVGAREFDAAEYSGHGTARLLAPGERADATLDILDPGKDAEGFEIDVCVRGSDKNIICATDAAAPPK